MLFNSDGLSALVIHKLCASYWEAKVVFQKVESAKGSNGVHGLHGVLRAMRLLGILLTATRNFFWAGSIFSPQ